jgi:hypothetical protein
MSCMAVGVFKYRQRGSASVFPYITARLPYLTSSPSTASAKSSNVSYNMIISPTILRTSLTSHLTFLSSACISTGSLLARSGNFANTIGRRRCWTIWLKSHFRRSAPRTSRCKCGSAAFKRENRRYGEIVLDTGWNRWK